MDPITLLAAFAPLAVDLGKSLIAKFVAPEQFKPATIEQYTQIKQLDLDMFKALNEAGGSNPSYLWVEAIVRLQRDRKSTRLNSSHITISYAVFCLKKKSKLKNTNNNKQQ